MTTFSEELKEVLASHRNANWKRHTLAIVEINDFTQPHLVLEMLTPNRNFERIFEVVMTSPEMAEYVQGGAVVRLSMYGQPVQLTLPGNGSRPLGNMQQTSDPEHAIGLCTGMSPG